MNKLQVGRKVKLDEETVKHIIYSYKTEHGLTQKITYSDIYNYSVELVKSGKITTRTSDSFWRKKGRLGRRLVDEANQVFTDTLSKQQIEHTKIPNITGLIHANFGDKEALLSQLIPVEEQFKNIQRQAYSIKKKNDEIIQELKISKEKHILLQEQLKKQESLIFSLFRYLQTGSKERTKNIATQAMEELFNSPLQFMDGYNQKDNNPSLPDNVVNLEKSNSKKKISERFIDKFDN